MTLEEAKTILFKEKPEFARLWQTYGEKTWIEYAKENYKVQNFAPERQGEFFEVLTETLLPLLGEEKTKRTINTIKQNSLVSTADHHGILCHPFFSNGSLLRSHRHIVNTESAIISFACGSISPSNSSYPRGIFFHDHNLKEERIPFLSLKDRKRPLYGIKSIKKEDIEKHLHRISAMNLKASAKKKLHNFLLKIVNSPLVWEQEYVSAQFTIINDILWTLLFGNNRGNLVYLETETLVRNLLLKHHIFTTSPISDILFNEETRSLYVHEFEGILGAHDANKNKGSHIFWYIDPKENTRKQLYLKGPYLQTNDGKVIISLTPETISTHLLDFTLMPTMAFSYSILAFYYGITLGGGFSQIQYLEEMSIAFKKIVKDHTPTKTNIFTGEEVLLTAGNEQNTRPASLIDLLLYSDTDRIDAIDEEIENTKINDTLSLMTPEFIEIIKGNKEDLKGLPEFPPTLHV